MTRTQLAVPLVAALLGSAVTAAAITATGDGTDTIGGPDVRQRSLLASGGGERPTTREIYERSAPSVVAIRARSLQPVASPFGAGEGAPGENISSGSGFVLDEDGYVVTSARVVSGVTDVQVTFPDLRAVQARVVGKDEETDLALLAVDPAGLDLRPLELGDSDAVRAGDRIVTVGNPSGLGATAGSGTVTAPRDQVETPAGVVLRDVIATDAVIEPATAGAPLVGADGRVIGIGSAIGALETGAGYAVPANTARDVLSELRESHRLIRPYLGIRGRTIDSARAAADGGAAAGVQLVDVYPGGPAAQVGLRGAESGGDVIEAIDGRPVTSLPELLAQVDAHRPGDTVTLTMLRDGSRQEIAVTLAERPTSLPAG
jgi:S1-C subfamily serine protease